MTFPAQELLPELERAEPGVHQAVEGSNLRQSHHPRSQQAQVAAKVARDVQATGRVWVRDLQEAGSSSSTCKPA